MSPEPTNEMELLRQIQLDLAGYPGLSLWRANVGRGWVSAGGKPIVEQMNGKKVVTIMNAMPFDTGLPEGFSDLFGILRRDADDPLPVFIEIKFQRGHLRPKQRAFLTAMRNAGCLAGVARSTEDAKKILAGEFLL